MARPLSFLLATLAPHPTHCISSAASDVYKSHLLCSLLGIDARGYRDRLDQAPACLNILDFKDAVRARLMLYNDTSHYAPQTRRAEGQLSKWWDTK